MIIADESALGEGSSAEGVYLCRFDSASKSGREVFDLLFVRTLFFQKGNNLTLEFFNSPTRLKQ